MTATPARSALDGLDALLAAATPGPWDLGPNWTGGWAVARASIEDPDGTPVFHPSGWTADDAALIVALRNTAPAMLAAIRAAYALAEELEAQAGDAERLAEGHRRAGNLTQSGVFAGKKVAKRDAAARLRAALDEALGVAK